MNVLRRFITVLFCAVLFVSALPVYTVSAAENEQDSAFLPSLEAPAADSPKSPFYNVTCVYDRKSSKVKLEYRMKSEDIKKYSNSKLSLYALLPSQTIQDIPSSEPVVTGLSLSNRSTAETKTDGLRGRLSSYVLVMDTGEGLIYSEPMMPAVNSSGCELSFKGIETADIGNAIDSVMGTAVVNIDVNSLVSGGSGYLYPAGNITYTFSSTYLDQIDSAVRIYRGAGCDVLLRIHSSSDTDGMFSGTYESQRNVYAYICYLYSRYSTDEYGGISGFIMGNSETTASVDVSAYANSLYAAAAGLNDMGSVCPLIVPVTDNLITTRNFVTSLCSALKPSGGPSFTVMLESTHQPYGITNGHIQQYISSLNDSETESPEALKPADAENDYLSSENVTTLTELLKGLPDYLTDESFIYMWIPDKELDDRTLSAAYIYDYYRLFNSGSAVSFIVSPGVDPPASFKDVIKYINTTRFNKRITDTPIPGYFGFESWEKAVYGFEQGETINVTLTENMLDLIKPEGVIGEFDYFDFSSTTGISGWYGGIGCTGISSDKNEIGRAMVSRINSGVGNSGGFIAFNYKYTESFRYTDYIAIGFSIEADVPSGSYNLNITLGGDNFIHQYSAVRFISGKKATVYLNVRDLDETQTAKYLRIGITGNDKAPQEFRLYIYSIKAESLDYDSDVLYEYIEAERERLKGVTEEQVTGLNKTAILFLTGTVLITAVIMIMIARKQRQLRSRKVQAGNETAQTKHKENWL